MKKSKQKTTKSKKLAPLKMAESLKTRVLAAELLESECQAMLSKPRFDVEKLGVHFCSGEKAERITRKAVLNTLKKRAKADAVEFNEQGRVGPEIAPIRWLYTQLAQLRNEFAAEIGQELDQLSESG